MSDDYRLLSVGEIIREGDEIAMGKTWQPNWEPVARGLIGDKVDPFGIIRRRTTLRDELAELANELDALDDDIAAESLRNILAKHYPQEPQS